MKGAPYRRAIRGQAHLCRRILRGSIWNSCLSTFTCEWTYGPGIDEPICLVDVADANETSQGIVMLSGA
jgi:hypothetical protein